MTEIEEDERPVILTDEEYFEQLDILYELHQIDSKKEILKKKLKKIKKKFSQQDDETSSIKLRALSKVKNELNRREEEIKLNLYDEFNLFSILTQIDKIKFFFKNLEKALKKKLIDKETYDIALKYYKDKLKQPSKNLNKLRIISRSYEGSLYNRTIDLEIEKKKTNDNNLASKINEIKTKQRFLNTI